MANQQTGLVQYDYQFKNEPYAIFSGAQPDHGTSLMSVPPSDNVSRISAFLRWRRSPQIPVHFVTVNANYGSTTPNPFARTLFQYLGRIGGTGLYPILGLNPNRPMFTEIGKANYNLTAVQNMPNTPQVYAGIQKKPVIWTNPAVATLKS